MPRVTPARFAIGLLAVTLTSWIWSVLFYVVSPLPYYAVQQPEDPVAAARSLREYFPESGTYILPGRSATREEGQLLRREGPVAHVFLEANGPPLSQGVKNLLGTLQGLAIGAWLGIAMLLLNRYTTKYWAHVAIVGSVAMAYTVYPRVADIVFSDYPPGYTLMMIFSDGVSFILMAMVMAYFTRPREA
ncbi:MAG: hypothetical protein FJ197_01015 [Gammaproteobacteria bacterium]|nr:hypothetical protein [Gammaproteobacteria bacterium]